MSRSQHNILITGADRGIGLGLSRYYLEEGESVVVTSRRMEPSSELSDLAQAFPRRLKIMSLDVAEEQSHARFADEIRNSDITFATVISNAGVTVPQDFGSWTVNGFMSNYLVNTVGPALLIQGIHSSLENGAKVVCISSGMGSIERNINPGNGLDAYAVSKCGLNILSRRVAGKLRARGIVVLALDPGWVKTDMGGPEAPTEIDDAVGQIIPTIERAGLDDTGSFISRNGTTIPW